MPLLGPFRRRYGKCQAGLALLMLAMIGCAEAEAPDPEPRPTDLTQTGDAIEPLANERAANSGRWSESAVDGQPALVHSGGIGPDLVLSCDGRQGINVDLRGQMAVPPLEMIRISTDGETSLYAARPLANQRTVRAAIPAPDVMVAAFRQAKPIQIRFGENEVITATASPLVPIFVNKCRAV